MGKARKPIAMLYEGKKGVTRRELELSGKVPWSIDFSKEDSPIRKHSSLK